MNYNNAATQLGLLLRLAILTAFLCLASSCRGQTERGVAENATWVEKIHTSKEWAVFPCKDYMVTNVCGTDKDYSDPGTLPPVIAVGDTVSYVSKKGKSKQFVIRHIENFIYDKDVDFTWGGQHLTAKKGDTLCTLYDAESRAATAENRYPSKLIIKGCKPNQ